VVTAFQRHFRPGRVDGVADHSTVIKLHALLTSLPGWGEGGREVSTLRNGLGTRWSEQNLETCAAHWPDASAQLLRTLTAKPVQLGRYCSGSALSLIKLAYLRLVELLCIVLLFSIKPNGWPVNEGYG
jgi:hypothetical protein